MRRKTPQFDDLKARDERSQGDERNYFRVETKCLGCGRRARIKMSRQRRKFRCRNCDTVMHIGQDGDWHVGPPPQASDPSAWIPASNKRYWSIRTLTTAYPFLQHRVFLTSVTAAVLLTAGVLVARSLLGPTLPETMRGRTVFLCDAVVDGQRDKFQQCVRSGTTDQALTVYDGLRDLLSRSAPGSKPQFLLETRYEKAKLRSGCVVATFYPARQDPATGPGRSAQAVFDRPVLAQGLRRPVAARRRSDVAKLAHGQGGVIECGRDSTSGR